MYETLTLQNHLGVTIAVIESIDGHRQMRFAQSRNLQLALEDFISNGFDVRRNVEGSVIRLSAKPTDEHFLLELSRLLQISYDYMPVYAQYETIRVRTCFLQREVETFKTVEYVSPVGSTWKDWLNNVKEEVHVVVLSSDAPRERGWDSIGQGPTMQYRVALSGWN